MHPILIQIGNLKIPSYGVCIALGLLLCGATLFFLIKKRGMPELLFDTYLTAALVGVVVGFGGAILFQTFYNYLATGEWNWGGMTFMGGLIGGVIGFLAYVLLCIKDKKAREAFWDVADMAFACILIAHCLGRIGCFLAGCCYGIKAPDGFLGVNFPGVDGARYPTQLFEAFFLLALYFVAVVYNLRTTKRGYGMGIYAIAYGVWRFFIEFLRGDERGGVEGAALSPSQIQSIIFVVVGIALIVVVTFLRKKGIIAPTIDWSAELASEEAVRAEKARIKAERKAASATSYEEYNESVEAAENESPTDQENGKKDE